MIYAGVERFYIIFARGNYLGKGKERGNKKQTKKKKKDSVTEGKKRWDEKGKI